LLTLPCAAVPPSVGPAAENAACVAEFKAGPVLGVVRLAQATPAAAADVALAGLPARAPFCVAVHARGDLRAGAASCGDPWPSSAAAVLCSGTAGADGAAACTVTALPLLSWELIGRACVIHAGLTPDGTPGSRLAGAVLARAAAVGANSAKRTCACDGTPLWEAR